MLSELGLPVNPEIRAVEGLEEVLYCEGWREHRHDLPYEIDGVVVKIDDLGQRERLARHVQGTPLGDRLQVPT